MCSMCGRSHAIGFRKPCILFTALSRIPHWASCPASLLSQNHCPSLSIGTMSQAIPYPCADMSVLLLPSFTRYSWRIGLRHVSKTAHLCVKVVLFTDCSTCLIGSRIEGVNMSMALHLTCSHPIGASNQSPIFIIWYSLGLIADCRSTAFLAPLARGVLHCIQREARGLDIQCTSDTFA